MDKNISWRLASTHCILQMRLSTSAALPLSPAAGTEVLRSAACEYGQSLTRWGGSGREAEAAGADVVEIRWWETAAEEADVCLGSSFQRVILQEATTETGSAWDQGSGSFLRRLWFPEVFLSVCQHKTHIYEDKIVLMLLEKKGKRLSFFWCGSFVWKSFFVWKDWRAEVQSAWDVKERLSRFFLFFCSTFLTVCTLINLFKSCISILTKCKNTVKHVIERKLDFAQFIYDWHNNKC